MAALIPIIEDVRSMVEKTPQTGLSSAAAFPKSFHDENSLKWTFSAFVAEQDAAFFEPIYLDRRLLNLKYMSLRDELGNAFTKKRANEKIIVQQVKAALAVSELLERIQKEDYLDAWQEVQTLRAEQEAYRHWLSLHGYQFPDTEEEEPINETPAGMPRTKFVRDWHDFLNPFRLFLVRLRRFFVLLVPILGSDSYGLGVAGAEKFTGPMFTYIAWIFFLPRLLSNLAVVGKHLIAPGENEQYLSPLTRLRAQLSRRWNEITNDIAWVISGFVACFVLVGSLMPLAIYVAIAMQWYDFVTSIFRALHEFPVLWELEQKYVLMKENAQKRKAYSEVDAIENYLIPLRERIAREQNLLILSIINFAVLAIAISLALMANPLVTLIGAVLAITMTIIQYFARESLRTSIPPNALNAKLLNAKPKQTMPADQHKIDKYNKSDDPQSPLRGHSVFKKKDKYKSTTMLGSVPVYGI